MTQISVMQLTDTLESGGAERVAVNFANLLPTDRYTSWLCTTRRDGPLDGLVASHVHRLALERATRFHISPIRRLARHVGANRIQILHAHGTSLFVGLLPSFQSPHPAVVWHIHHLHQRGEYAPWIYRLAARRAAAVVAVSEQVAEWATRRLGLAPHRVVYLPNFSVHPQTAGAAADLPGRKGSRIVSVGNLRPEKDQCTLIAAFERLVRVAPDAHLLLVGGGSDSYRQRVIEAIAQRGLERHVSLIGERTDIPAVLAQCDIAVLSSATEGFPLSLIEYGQAGLPVVATRVGQCPEVLDDGDAGLLVEPRDPAQLGAALLSLWHSRAQRRLLAKRLKQRIHDRYSADRGIAHLCELYERIARSRDDRAHAA